MLLEKLPKLVPYTPVPAVHDGSFVSRSVATEAAGEEGTTEDQALPLQPYEWWVDTDGNLVTLVVTGNICGMEPGDQNIDRRRGGFQHPDFDHRYHKQVTSERRRKKWIDVAEFLEAHPKDGEQRLVAEINQRRQRCARLSQRHTDAAMTQNDLLRAALEGNKQAIKDLVGAVAKGIKVKD